tara:strand:- start:1630 stop:2064 length:435 start_codon:yes stop_codon:yes gene_type:complete
MKNLILLLFIPLVFACSDEGVNNSEDVSVIGKWYAVKYEYYSNGVLDNIDNIEEYEINGCRSYVEFNSDSSLEFATVFLDCSGFDGQTYGTWELINNSNTLRMSYNSGTFDWDIVTLDNNNLVLEIEECEGNDECFRTIMFYEK